MRKTYWSTCKATGKRRFRTEKDARQALGATQKLGAQWRMKGERMRKEKRFYECDFCDGFHLTSQKLDTR